MRKEILLWSGIFGFLMAFSSLAFADYFIVTGYSGNYTINATYNATDNASILHLPNPYYCDLNVYERIQAYYLFDDGSKAIPDGNVTFTINGNIYPMDYNATSKAYEIFVKSDEIGTLNWTINANHTWFDNQTSSGFCRVRQPYYVAIQLWQDKNMTSNYINNFAWLFARSDNYKCGNNETELCHFVGQYVYGVGYIKLYEPESVNAVSYDLYITEGHLAQAEPFGQPYLTDRPDHPLFPSDYKLGTFEMGRETEELHLYVGGKYGSLNIWTDLWAWVILIAKLFGAIVIFIALFYITGELWISLVLSGLATFLIMLL